MPNALCFSFVYKNRKLGHILKGDGIQSSTYATVRSCVTRLSLYLRQHFLPTWNKSKCIIYNISVTICI